MFEWYAEITFRYIYLNFVLSLVTHVGVTFYAEILI